MFEDDFLDDFGTSDYEDDAETFERNQLALDNEFDEPYDEDEDDWFEEDGWSDEDSEPPF